MTNHGPPGANTSSGSSAAMPAAVNCVTRRLPNRDDPQPASGMATTAPSAIASSASPSMPWLRPRAACNAGMRETQVANSVPFMKKVSATANRAALSERWQLVGAGKEGVGGKGSMAVAVRG